MERIIFASNSIFENFFNITFLQMQQFLFIILLLLQFQINKIEMYESQIQASNTRRRNYIFSQRRTSVQRNNSKPTQLCASPNIKLFEQPDKIVERISLSRSKEKLLFNQQQHKKDHQKVVNYCHVETSPKNYNTQSLFHENISKANQNQHRSQADFSHIQFVHAQTFYRNQQQTHKYTNANPRQTENKAKLPIKDKNNIQQIAQLNAKNTIIELKNLLFHNQQKVLRLQKELATIHSQLLRMYNQHQAQLKAKISMRCEQFVSMIKKITNAVKIRQQCIVKIDQKVALFSNTLRNVSQKLRLLSIKQDCTQIIANRKLSDLNSQKTRKYQSLSQTKKSYESSRANDQKSQSLKKLKKMENKGIIIEQSGVYNFEQFEQQFDKDRLTNLPEKSNNYFQTMQQNTKKPISPIQKKLGGQKLRVQDFLKEQQSRHSSKLFNFKLGLRPYNVNTINQLFENKQELDRVSPFQANQMIRHSVSLPLRTKNILKRQDIQELQYFKLQNLNRHQIPLNATDFQTFNQHRYNLIQQKAPKNIIVSFQKQQSNDSAQKQQPNHLRAQSNQKLSRINKNRVQQIIEVLKSPKKSQNPVKCYLDQLGCLRRANNTYFFQENGNVVMLTTPQFEYFIRIGAIQRLRKIQ